MGTTQAEEPDRHLTNLMGEQQTEIPSDVDIPQRDLTFDLEVQRVNLEGEVEGEDPEGEDPENEDPEDEEEENADDRTGEDEDEIPEGGEDDDAANGQRTQDDDFADLFRELH